MSHKSVLILDPKTIFKYAQLFKNYLEFLGMTNDPKSDQRSAIIEALEKRRSPFKFENRRNALYSLGRLGEHVDFSWFSEQHDDLHLPLMRAAKLEEYFPDDLIITNKYLKEDGDPKKNIATWRQVFNYLLSNNSYEGIFVAEKDRENAFVAATQLVELGRGDAAYYVNPRFRQNGSPPSNYPSSFREIRYLSDLAKIQLD